MIEFKQFDLFKNFLTKEPNVSLMNFEEDELKHDFPIIGRGVQDLLRVLMKTFNPKRVLELGSGHGFSSIFMAEYGTGLKELITVEKSKKNYETVLKNIKKYGHEDVINCILGDAKDIIKTDIKGEFDFIFVDNAKAQYGQMWETLRSMVKPGGIILTDDILQNDSILSSRFLLNRRDRTIHKRMREYLYMQMNDEDFTGAVFEIDDGISLMVKNKDE